MQCISCGADIPENSRVCPSCGVTLKNRTYPKTRSSLRSKGFECVYAGPDGPFTTLNETDCTQNERSVFSKVFIPYFIFLFCLIPSLIFQILPQFRAEEYVDGTQKVNFNIYTDIPDVDIAWMYTFLIVSFASAVIFAVIPLFCPKSTSLWRPGFTLCAKITSIMTLFVIAFWAIICSMVNDIAEGYLGIGLSVYGWLFLVFDLATVVTSFIYSSKLKAALRGK